MSDRVAQRRLATKEEILSAAWELAARDGIAGLSLRDLAAEVGMQAPSLYTYFDGKGAIYDALFAAGYRELDERTRAVIAALPSDPPRHVLLTSAAETFLDFCTENPARYQLMFTHAIPGWEPSEEAYAVSVTSYARMVEAFAAAGITDPRHIDLQTALTAGLAAQQLANDPDGTRWRDLVPDAVAMFLRHIDQQESSDERSRRPRGGAAPHPVPR